MSTICQECVEATGGCCTDVHFCIHISELKPFKEAFEANPEFKKTHLLKKFDGDDVYLYDSREKPCIFLEQGKCSIYEERPLTCRMYPIMWKERSIHLDMACPVTHAVPIRDIMKWLEDKKVIKQIKNIEALDFNERLAQYISVTYMQKTSECLEIIYGKDILPHREK